MPEDCPGLRRPSRCGCGPSGCWYVWGLSGEKMRGRTPGAGDGIVDALLRLRMEVGVGTMAFTSVRGYCVVGR